MKCRALLRFASCEDGYVAIQCITGKSQVTCLKWFRIWFRGEGLIYEILPNEDLSFDLFQACGCCVDVCITQRKPSSWKGFTNKAHLDLSWGSLWSMFHYFVPMYFPNATKTCKMIKSATYIKGKFPKFVLKSLLQCLLLLSFLKRVSPSHTYPSTTFRHSFG